MQELRISKEDDLFIKRMAYLWWKAHPRYKDDIIQLAYESYFLASEDWQNFDHDTRPDVTREQFINIHLRSYLRKFVLREICMIQLPTFQQLGVREKKDKYVHNTFCSDDILLLSYHVNPNLETYCDKKRMRENLQEFYPTLSPKRQEWFKLWLNEVSFTDIGKMYGVTKQAVEGAVKKDIKKFKKLYYRNKCS